MDDIVKMAGREIEGSDIPFYKVNAQMPVLLGGATKDRNINRGVVALHHPYKPLAHQAGGASHKHFQHFHSFPHAINSSRSSIFGVISSIGSRINLLSLSVLPILQAYLRTNGDSTFIMAGPGDCSMPKISRQSLLHMISLYGKSKADAIRLGVGVVNPDPRSAPNRRPKRASCMDTTEPYPPL